MRCASRSIDFWLGGGEAGRWDPIFVCAMIVIGIFVLARRPCKWGRVFEHNRAIFAFYGFMIVSVAWATALENPAIKILRPVGDLIMALVVVTEPNPRQAIATMFRRCAILLIPLSIVLIRYFPSLGRGFNKHWGNDPWIGVTTHKNPLGQLCIVSGLAFLWSLAEARRKGEPLLRQSLAWLYVAMTLYLFNAGGISRSSTAIVCFVLAVALFIVFGLMRKQPQMVIRRIVLGALILAASAITLEMFGSSLQAVVAGLQGKEANLTGRTWLWHDVIRLGMRHPMLGSGYGAFWVPSIYDELSPEVDNFPAEAHNGFLETFANLGLVGVGLLCWVILQTLGSASRVIRTDFEYGRLRLVLLFMVLVMNYAEATFPRGTHLWWFGFLVVAVYARPWVFWPETQQSKLGVARPEVAAHP